MLLVCGCHSTVAALLLGISLLAAVMRRAHSFP